MSRYIDHSHWQSGCSVIGWLHWDKNKKAAHLCKQGDTILVTDQFFQTCSIGSKQSHSESQQIILRLPITGSYSLQGGAKKKKKPEQPTTYRRVVPGRLPYNSNHGGMVLWKHRQLGHLNTEQRGPEINQDKLSTLVFHGGGKPQWRKGNVLFMGEDIAHSTKVVQIAASV